MSDKDKPVEHEDGDKEKPVDHENANKSKTGIVRDKATLADRRKKAIPVMIFLLIAVFGIMLTTFRDKKPKTPPVPEQQTMNATTRASLLSANPTDESGKGKVKFEAQVDPASAKPISFEEQYGGGKKAPQQSGGGPAVPAPIGSGIGSGGGGGGGANNEDWMDAPLAFALGDQKELSAATSNNSPSNQGAGSSAAKTQTTPNFSNADLRDILSGTNRNLPNNNGSVNLASTKTATTHASLVTDRNLIMSKGTVINCVLETAILSQLPGMTSCRVTKNIWSDSGQVLLVERGSVITGEYRNTTEQGQARIFVIWDRIRTPKGVLIDLDSPGTDTLGRSGINGDVDNHWMQRIGAAVLLSTIQDVIAYSAAQKGTSTGQAAYQNIQSTGSETANTVLKSTINIPPTISRDHGTRIMIFVSRDLDFAPVYKLSLMAGHDGEVDN